MKKRQIILISGLANVGKTNTVAMLYRNLAAQYLAHEFNREKVNSSQISGIVSGFDFNAKFTLKNGKTLVLISRGDYIEDTKADIKEFCDADIFVITEQVSPRKKPVLDYILSELYPQNFRLALHFNLLKREDMSETTEMQTNIVDCIVGVLSKL